MTADTRSWISPRIASLPLRREVSTAKPRPVELAKRRRSAVPCYGNLQCQCPWRFAAVTAATAGDPLAAITIAPPPTVATPNGGSWRT